MTHPFSRARTALGEPEPPQAIPPDLSELGRKIRGKTVATTATSKDDSTLWIEFEGGLRVAFAAAQGFAMSRPFIRVAILEHLPAKRTLVIAFASRFSECMGRHPGASFLSAQSVSSTEPAEPFEHIAVYGGTFPQIDWLLNNMNAEGVTSEFRP